MLQVLQNPHLHPHARKNIALLNGALDGTLTPDVWALDDTKRAGLEMRLMARLGMRMQEAVKAGNIAEEAWLDNYVGIASRAMRFAEKLC
jgi:hypothetical protein